MIAHLDCVACIVAQAVRMARLATDDPELRERVLVGTLRELGEGDIRRTPLELGAIPQRLLETLVGVRDPYLKMRDEANRFALELYPRLRELVEASDEPLLAAAKIAISGNIIDAGVGSGPEDVDETLRRVLERPLGGNGYPAFREKLANAETVLYLTDNAGEIVFDRLLIECMNVPRMIVCVRGEPFLNDAMMPDALQAGLDKTATLIESPLYPRRSEALAAAWDEADLIIAKGQANYESYSEAEGPLAFLLMAKCEIVAESLGCTKGDGVLWVR